MQQLADLVLGKSVALVGNALSITQHPKPKEIDEHDIVIRMNMGIPPRIPGSIIGKRTDVWATAKHFPGCWPDGCKLIVFMKLTALGDSHWDSLRASSNSIPKIRWPMDLEDLCRCYVGADPGTGIRLLWWLKTQADPLDVDLYGFDCWETASHWSGRKNTPNHRPDLERVALEKLCAS